MNLRNQRQLHYLTHAQAFNTISVARGRPASRAQSFIAGCAFGALALAIVLMMVL